MENNDLYIDNDADIELNKPSKARFLFLLGFLGFFVFFAACNYGLFTKKYKSNADVEVPDHTKYTPKYDK
jgi:hypothetical protein